MFDEALLRGKRILITGGATGLGRAMAHRFLELGADVAICGRRENVLAQARHELEHATGGNVETVACDIRDAARVDEMLETIWSKRPLDVVVNNAAGNFIARTETLSPRAVDAVLGTVLHGTAYVTLGCGRRWIASAQPGTILNIITTYAWTGSGYVVPSAMAKAGVLAMTRSLAAEWGRYKIRSNAIAPGAFPTEGAWSRLVPIEGLEDRMRERVPLGRFGASEELANLAAFLVSDGAAFINGAEVTIDGGEWLMGAGQFNALARLQPQDWDRIRAAQPVRTPPR